MIEEQAKVVKVDGYQLTIEASRQSACGKCAEQSDCGQSSIAQWAASKMVNIVVNKPAQFPVSVGDVVVVGIDEKSFIKASAIIYFAPLLVMFLAALIAQGLGALEWQVIAVAFLGLMASFYVIKFISQYLENNAHYQLTVLSIIK